jgi:hypothetical protein
MVEYRLNMNKDKTLIMIMNIFRNSDTGISINFKDAMIQKVNIFV